jgi:hypothetical protein
MKSIDREAESKKCLQGEPRRALTKKKYREISLLTKEAENLF